MTSTDTEHVPFDLLDLLLDFENGTIVEDDLVELFQYLVDTGAAWSLQGTYGRTARDLIEAGYITEPGQHGREEN